MMAWMYLHGFSSGPGSLKGQHMRRAFEARGEALAMADLNQPSFSQITVTGALAEVDRIAATRAPEARWGLIGSSFGGYVAALWAAKHPERVSKLVLLCPGLDLQGRWPALLGEARMTQWREQGWLDFPDARDVPTPVDWNFVEDIAHYPAYPEIMCPTMLLHGTGDEVVPVTSSRRYAASLANVTLIEVDDDHRLARSTPLITMKTLAFMLDA